MEGLVKASASTNRVTVVHSQLVVAASSFVASTGVYSSVQTIGPTNPTIDTRVQGFIRIFY
ncbi:MAG: hypothetical protein V9E81_06295 [Marmoricola sp.]